jgi:hypothetical protein
MCGYKHEQVATKTVENAQQENTQRGSGVETWTQGAKRKVKSFPQCLKKSERFHWLLKIIKVKKIGEKWFNIK